MSIPQLEGSRDIPNFVPYTYSLHYFQCPNTLFTIIKEPKVWQTQRLFKRKKKKKNPAIDLFLPKGLEHRNDRDTK